MNIDMLELKRLMDQRKILRIHLKDSKVSMDVIFHLVNRSGFVARMWAKADHQDIVQNPKTKDGLN